METGVTNRGDGIAKPTAYKQYKEEVFLLPGGKEFTESVLIEKIKKRDDVAEPYYQELKKAADLARNYYNGKQIDQNDVQSKEIPVVVNRILQSVETVVPIATEQTPDPQIIITPRNRQTRNLEQKLYKQLKNFWDIEGQMQHKLENAIRTLAIGRYVAFKVVWDEEQGCFDCLMMPLNKIKFIKEATTEADLPFVIEYVTDSVANIKERFPGASEEFEMAVKGSADSDDSLVTYIEYWENEFVAYKYKDVLLGFERNPYWNWGDEQVEPGQEPFKLNYFKKPRHPYILVNFMSLGDRIADDVGWIEQVIPLQNNVNERKKQFEQNSRMQNGMLVVAGSAMTKEDAGAISYDPTTVLYLPTAQTTAGAFDFLKSTPLGTEAFNDMKDSESEIDNIFGTHSTTRGERSEQETALGRQILKSSDVGRIGLLTRRLELAAQKIYDYDIQMMYVNYGKPYPVISYEQENPMEELTVSQKEDFIQRDEFKDINIKVLVKKGSTSPKDQLSEQSQAVDLAKAGLMSKLDMYKELDYPNPEKLARNAALEAVDPAAFYAELSENIDIKAIRDLEVIIDQRQDKMDSVGLDSQDPEVMQKYLTTLLNYVKGVDIDEDITPYESLPNEVKMQVADFILQQKDSIKQVTDMIQQKQEMAGQAPTDIAGTLQGSPQAPQVDPNTGAPLQQQAPQNAPQPDLGVPQEVPPQM